MSFLIDYDFTVPTNYTYDSDKVEVVGDKAKLKSLIPLDATFYANYNTNVNGTWGSGVLTGIPIGGASVNGGLLDLAHSDKRYVNYDAVDNADSQQTGCIRFKYVPNFITPVGEHYVFSICKENNSLLNLIAYRDTGSHHRLHIHDSTGASIIECYFGYKQWVASQEYEIEFNWDLTIGEIRMFIDGVQFSTTKIATGTRDSDINLFRIGSNYQASSNSNFSINTIVLFSTVQHTANYTPDWSIVPDSKYDISNPNIITNASFRHENLDDFIETINISGGDNVKYQLSKNGVWYYWNGTIWVVSNGSYTQSNTGSEIIANKDSFTGDVITTQIKVLLHSAIGDTTPDIDKIAIEYDYAGEDPDIVDKCIVWGYLVDEKGFVMNNKSFEVYLNNDVIKYKTNIMIRNKRVKVFPKATNGYWEVELVENDNMLSANEESVKYIFDFGDNMKYEKTVPNTTLKNYFELV